MANKGINKVILVGNVGNKDVRNLPDGRTITNISLATTESWKDKSGQQQDRTEWHKVVIFGKTAEIASQYLSKGSQVYFEGKLSTKKWQDNAGATRYTTEVVVDGFSGVMQMLGNSTVKPEKEETPVIDNKPHVEPMEPFNNDTKSDDYFGIGTTVNNDWAEKDPYPF